LGLGERTRRIMTVHSGQHATTREHTVRRWPSAATAAVFGRIEYDDESGHHVHEIRTDSVTIGRGGVAYPVDVRIATSADVSRGHGSFFSRHAAFLRHRPSGSAAVLIRRSNSQCGRPAR